MLEMCNYRSSLLSKNTLRLRAPLVVMMIDPQMSGWVLQMLTVAALLSSDALKVTCSTDVENVQLQIKFAVKKYAKDTCSFSSYDD